MRLDHLLSKELQRAPVALASSGVGVVCGGHGPRRSRVGVVAHGWNIDEERRSWVVSVPAGWWSWSSCFGGVVRLLVPVVEHHGSGSGFDEHTVGSSGHRPPVGGVPGTGRSVDREPLASVMGWVGGSGAGRGRWLFENCTVDASIFELIKRCDPATCCG